MWNWYPDVSIPVKFTFSNTDAKGVITGVAVNGNPVSNYLDSNFSVKAGDKLTVTVDRSNYSLDSFKYNEIEYNVYSSLDLYILDAANFDISAHKYGTVKAIIDIDAIICVEKKSHKGMVIGKNGDMILKIGKSARIDIEKFLDSKVNLKLFVKIDDDWRNKSFKVKEFGYFRK